MLPEGEPVPEDGRKRLRTKEEEEEEGQKELYGRNGNQDSEQGERGKHGNQESDETEEGKTEELDPRKRENDEYGEKEEERRRRAAEKGKQPMHKGGGQSDEEENGDDEEEEEKGRIRRAAGKGKQPMSKLGMSKGALDPDYYDYDYDYHQNLVILRTMWDFKCKTGYFPHPPSFKLLDFIMYSLPYLEISREKLAKKIIAFKNNYNDAWELDGDNPGLDRPVNREIFNLSMRLWGNHKEFYHDWKWK